MLRFISLPLIFCFSVFSCPDTSFEWQSNCYIFNLQPTGFEEAEANCVQRGGHLMSIHDAFLNDLITRNASNYLYFSSDLWIGANSLTTNNVWGWTDGSSFDFNDWGKGEPQNSNGMNCASLSKDDGYWRAESCATLKPYVCQIVSVTNCTSGWTYFKRTNSYYCAYFTKPLLTWGEGENYCKTFGGHLSSVHSYEESRLIWTTAGFYCMSAPRIGLYSDDNGTTYRWSDGSNVDYLNWGDGYPSTYAGTCGILFGSNCNDVTKIKMENNPCSATQNFVCKKA